jgi:hypothetical protein
VEFEWANRDTFVGQDLRIQVDEKGTRAAALMYAGSGAMGGSVGKADSFHLRNPFVFAIWNHAAKTLLFTGVIFNPDAVIPQVALMMHKDVKFGKWTCFKKDAEVMVPKTATTEEIAKAMRESIATRFRSWQGPDVLAFAEEAVMEVVKDLKELKELDGKTLMEKYKLAKEFSDSSDNHPFRGVPLDSRKSIMDFLKSVEELTFFEKQFKDLVVEYEYSYWDPEDTTFHEKKTDVVSYDMKNKKPHKLGREALNGVNLRLVGLESSGSEGITVTLGK